MNSSTSVTSQRNFTQVLDRDNATLSKYNAEIQKLNSTVSRLESANTILVSSTTLTDITSAIHVAAAYSANVSVQIALFENESLSGTLNASQISHLQIEIGQLQQYVEIASNLISAHSRVSVGASSSVKVS